MSKYYPELGLTREKLLKKVKSQMSKKRYEHVLAVEEQAIKLAKIHGVDEYKAGLAGLLHDYAKELPTEDFKRLIIEYGLDRDLLSWGNNVLHGMVGIYKIQEDIGLKDEEILHAIKVHTVGCPEMSDLDKVVYVADYIEPHRDFPGVNKARKLAKEDLDEAVAYETRGTVKHLIDREIKIYPQTLETYNYYIDYLK
ncbi:bis(5'-nucleosyl)-tetraphosphatase (symmetrical) YqeK [Floricoccus penangensis]|uniref:bis(5'-nucleosyl)-tetraphosphatase (symmetrical) YqeK n=1 Tax=Floricoccus penangensis TaxID=1859475 RepID=UPI00203DA101|nr:bis(5'-nucleosyl)-tetraphosphatase (symmetrical) YqeK [Floricoccus penangensis]URZ87361.1 bis(5'-nucleosyl)-tetraphosphatase (symmetrical) YqeK [Floricoccus penangensis]